MKLVDPLGAAARVVGVFHAPFLPSTAAALAAAGRDGLCVQSIGGLPEASPGKIVRVCRAGAEPHPIDLRPLGPLATADAADGADEDAAALNRAALDGEPIAAARAAATAAVWLHAARGLEPLAAAEAARHALVSGDARARAAALRDA
jgi:anthranilate phosphoribosyltransferase